MAHLIDFIEAEGIDITRISNDHIHTLLATIRDMGISPRSQARMIAGIRSFFRFLRTEGYIKTDPSELIESPRLGRDLPDVLSVEEIDAMIAAIPPRQRGIAAKPRNHRDPLRVRATGVGAC